MTPLRHQYLAHVISNLLLCREHFRLTLSADGFPPTRPGQFIQISCRDPDQDYAREREISYSQFLAPDIHSIELREPLALLRRPFSLAGRDENGPSARLEIIHRVVGVGTAWLARLREGDPVDILGPLGNTFTLPQGNGIAILVGGGVGIPPMLYLAQVLAGKGAVALCGAVTRELLPLTIEPAPPTSQTTPALRVREFSVHKIPSIISTDDGSFGFRGYVTQALERWLESSPIPAGSIVYTCGPEPMMKRVAEIASNHGIECQVAVERAMACGMGTCQSCCIRVRKPDPQKPPLVGGDWCWRLACTDGPIFLGAELLW